MTYKNVLDTAKRLDRAQRDVDRKSAQRQSMTLDGSTAKRRAAASDALTVACFERDRLIDDLHAELVDAGICEPKPPEFYAQRQISHSAGHGHRIDFLYRPKLPRVVADMEAI